AADVRCCGHMECALAGRLCLSCHAPGWPQLWDISRQRQRSREPPPRPVLPLRSHAGSAGAATARTFARFSLHVGFAPGLRFASPMSAVADAESPAPVRLLSGYSPALDGYDEMLHPLGFPRQHWEKVVHSLDHLAPGELRARADTARRIIS